MTVLTYNFHKIHVKDVLKPCLVTLPWASQLLNISHFQGPYCLFNEPTFLFKVSVFEDDSYGFNSIFYYNIVYDTKTIVPS